MKYIILWAFVNIHTGDMSSPIPVEPVKLYTADQCIQKLLNTGIQKPDKNGNVKVYECVAPPNRPTMQYTWM